MYVLAYGNRSGIDRVTRIPRICVQEEITTSEPGSVGFQANTYDKVKYVGLKDTFTITPLVC